MAALVGVGDGELNSAMAYIPALRFNWLTGFYDPLVRATTREGTFKPRLIEAAAIKPGHRVLDLGCGTATLAIEIKRRVPDAQVSGLDGDPEILNIARNKANQASVQIALETGMSFALPYADASFDRVFATLLFHHLTRADKARTLREVYRVLKPGGQLYVADWGKAQNRLMRALFLLVQILDGFENTADNVNGLLPQLIREAGLQPVRQIADYPTMFGTLSLHTAPRPAGAPPPSPGHSPGP